MRIADGPAYVRSHGYATDLLDSDNFLGPPMHHGEVHVGSFLLAAQEGALQFSDEDADVLELFAAQAAAAVANARAHREERRARADLEAPVETSPVGSMAPKQQDGVPSAAAGEHPRRYARP